MGKMNDIQREIEDCFESGLSVTDTARRLGISVSLVARAYSDLQDEFYMDQEDRSYIAWQVSRYTPRVEIGHDWD